MDIDVSDHHSSSADNAARAAFNLLDSDAPFSEIFLRMSGLQFGTHPSGGPSTSLKVGHPTARAPTEDGNDATADTTHASSPSPTPSPYGAECEMIKITSRPCEGLDCFWHSDQDLAEALIAQGVEGRLGALAFVLAEHGEDEYSSLCRTRTTAASDTAVKFSRALDDKIFARRYTIKDRATDSHMRTFDRAAKSARKDHAIELIACTQAYLDSIEAAFMSTIELHQGGAELDARLTALTRTFIANSTKAQSGPLRTVHNSLKWLHSPERKRGEETAAQRAERIGKRPKKRGKKTGKQAT
ncbi:uncharacterized protein LOC62_07G009466 [Vanrija pseudolonga]|uniref:Uncharacterized protein n=1 Tax=Vanrija pseudolonga TaxID=143232 RepID=A0AAF1BUE8_9TREE|nr:hypothetical protein LOC62_07G009466 [Vanrija pseudolonga]